MTDRAVSETLGFVFVFALIVTTTAVVYTLGTQNLQNFRDQEQLNNAELAFDVLGENMNDLRERPIPSRATEVRLVGARLVYGDPVEINVSGVLHETGNPPDPSVSFSETYTTTPIIYRNDAVEGAQFLYVGGMVIRENSGGAVMVSDPDYIIGPDNSLVSVIEVRPADPDAARAGDKTVLVRGEAVGRDALVTETRRYDLTINVSTSRAEVWRDYLDGQPGVDCPDATNDENFASCKTTTESVFVTRTVVETNFE